MSFLDSLDRCVACVSQFLGWHLVVDLEMLHCCHIQFPVWGVKLEAHG